jgi:hypothetical protein
MKLWVQQNLFHLNRSCNSFSTIFGIFLHYGIPKNFKIWNLNKSGLFGWMRPMTELRRWTRLCSGLPSRPTPEPSPVRHGPTGWRSRHAERIRTASTRMGHAGRQDCRGVTDSRGAPARLRRARAPPRTLVGHPHDGGELAGQRGIGSGYGLTGGVGVPAYGGFPRFRSIGETIREVGRSLQRRGLENGAGSEALTGEGRRGGQSRGGVAVPSSFRCSCAKKKGDCGRRVLGPWWIEERCGGWRSSPVWCSRRCSGEQRG